MQNENGATFIFDKNNTTQVRAYFSEFKGKKYFHLREWWRKDEDEEWKPGKGVTLPESKAQPFLSALALHFTQ